MTEPENNQEPSFYGRDFLGLAIGALALFLGVSVVQSRRAGYSNDPGNVEAIVWRYVELFGFYPGLVLCAGLVVFGVVFFISGPRDTSPRNLFGILGTTLGLSFLFGAVANAGGLIGRAGYAVYETLGVAGWLVGAIPVLFVAWFAWLRGRDLSAAFPRRSADPREAITTNKFEGVSSAEADELASARAEADLSRAREAAAAAIVQAKEQWKADVPAYEPVRLEPLYPEDVRLKGEIPAGATPLPTEGSTRPPSPAAPAAETVDAGSPREPGAAAPASPASDSGLAEAPMVEPEPPAWEQSDLFTGSDPEPEPEPRVVEPVAAVDLAPAAPEEELEDESAELDEEGLEEYEDDGDDGDEEYEDDYKEEGDDEDEGEEGDGEEGDEDAEAAELDEEYDEEYDEEDEDEDEELEDEDEDEDDEEDLDEEYDEEDALDSEVYAEEEPEPEVVLAPRGARAAAPAPDPVPDPDELYVRAGDLIVERGRVAVSMLQREFEIDFKQATELLDRLQMEGLIGPYVGGQQREILMSSEEWRSKVGVS